MSHRTVKAALDSALELRFLMTCVILPTLISFSIPNRGRTLPVGSIALNGILDKISKMNLPPSK